MPKKADETVWMNKTKKGDGAVLNLDDGAYYVKLDKIQKWLDGEIDYGLPIDKLPEQD